MKLKTWQKHVVSVIVLMAGGYVLFILAFMVFAFVVNGLMALGGLPENTSPPAISKVLAYILILVASWLVLKSRLPVLVKATVLQMPLMVTLVLTGIALYGQSIVLIIILGTVVIGATAAFIVYRKLSWQYWFSTGYVGVLALGIMIFDIQI
jgi:uncharacterized membrane protein YdjX (TVP38/TMEM64 family)